jgi:hypothetical protein
VRYADLTEEQRCILLNAVEESYLFEVLNECAPGDDWPDRIPHIPHLAKVLESFLDNGLISLTKDAGPGERPVDVPDKDARDIVADAENWWSEDGGRPISVVATDKGLAVYQGGDVAIDL